MTKVNRVVAFPSDMQGRWLIEDEPTCELVIDGGEITCFGQKIEYDYKEINEIDGALTVDLKINDETSEGTFQRQNIIGLVITPEGQFLGWNVKFGVQFVRPES
jgi:hypothetical protein